MAGGAPAHSDQVGADRLRLQCAVRQVSRRMCRHSQEQADKVRNPGGEVMNNDVELQRIKVNPTFTFMYIHAVGL